MVVLESHNSGTELVLRGHWTTTHHCQLCNGTGCSECYGKINCACSDCYKPETRTFKIQKAKILHLKLDKPKVLDPFDPEPDSAVISHEVSRATLRAGVEEVRVEEGVVRRGHSSLQTKRRPVTFMETLHLNRQHRLSVPDLQVRSPPERPRPRDRRREEFQERAVGPPKQTRYFCKTCNTDVCNACFSSVCGSHNVQFLGSAYFHCKSPFHKIQHNN